MLGLPPNYEWLQPWFVGAAVFFGVASVICFFWPLLFGRAGKKSSPSVQQDEQTARQSKVDFAHWNGVNKFTLLQAACLWADIEPVRTLKEFKKLPKAQARYQMLTEAVERDELTACLPSGDPTFSVSIPRQHAPDMWVFRRDLEKLASAKGETPLFLFAHTEDATKRAIRSKKEIPIALKIDGLLSFSAQHEFRTVVGDPWAGKGAIWDFGKILITNVSNTHSVSLDIFLLIPKNIRMRADGQGPFATEYGISDEMGRGARKARINIDVFRCPIPLPPQSSVEKRLVFIHGLDSPWRDYLLTTEVVSMSKFEITITDHVSGVTKVFTTPFDYRGV
jgi:hypothetical protein